MELFGFKSFPARTSLSFNSGITSVVGPNGCGKSNIVDSIRWVLGEQSAKSLRGDRMEAVIFSGSNKRNPASLSEVSLVVENNHDLSGNGSSKTKVTRRLYRNGESEYLLNGVPCLLRDISELFADTGIGASAYTVMEQQMVESLISDKDENRREVFDEAAGITKYKLKRRLAERKLDSTQADLLRLTDLVTEVEKQVNSLKRQMKKAEGYKKLKDELKELELRIAKKQLQETRQRLNEIESELDLFFSAKQSGSAELSLQELELEQLKLELLSVEKQVDSAREEVEQTSARLFKEQETIAVNNQRILSLEENQIRLQKESGLVHGQKAEYEKTIVQKKQEALELIQKLEESAAEQKLHQSRAKKLESQVEILRQNLDQLNQARSEQALRWQQKEVFLQNLQQRSVELEQREKEIEQNRQVKQELVNELVQKGKEKSEQIAGLGNKIQKLETQRQSIVLQAGDSEKRIETAEGQMAELHTKLAAEKSRREVLLELWKSYSGYQEGVKSLIQQKEKFGLIDTVANLLKTEEIYLAAVEAALGEKAGFLVAQDWNSVLSAIKELGHQYWGEVGFVTAGSAPGQAERIGTSLIEGLIPLSRIVKSDGQKLEKLAAALLDKIYLVDSVQQAQELMPRLPSDVILVTKQGQLFSPAGYAKGGKRKGFSLLGRQEQIQRAEKNIEQFQYELGQLTEDRDFSQSRLSANLENSKLIEAEIEKLEKDLNQSKLELAELKAQEKHLLEGLTGYKEEFGRTADLKRSFQIELASLQAEVSQGKVRLNSLEREFTQQKTELQESEAKLYLANQGLNQMVVGLVTLEGQKERLENDIQRLGEAVAQSGLDIESRSEQKVKTEQEMKTAQLTIQASQKQLQTLNEQKEVKSAALRSQAERQHQLLETINARENQLKGLRKTQSESLQEVHQLELSRQELRLQHKQIKDRIWEEYEVDLDSVPSLEAQELEQFAAYVEQISDLRGKLKNCGAVNLLALEEYQREKERYDFLKKQMDDLIAAKETLESTITKINHTARSLFLETFEKVRGNFQEVLANLFEGGDAGLALEPGVDPLEAKIEILAKPRGKKLVTLAQLSGGEKALVAISLLFSVYMVKPSPFCILDEVDAPLDDANIGRFIKLVRQFTDRTQFVIITHNKLTMEAADSLYGVTMAEPGESQIVSVRLNREPVSA